MAKHAMIENEIARLRTLSPDTLSAYTVRLPPGFALQAAYFAKDRNYPMSRGLVEIFEAHLAALSEGVVLEFTPDIRRQLDLIASAMGTTRDAVVQRIIGENLVRYLQQAVAIQGERNEVERTMAAIASDTAAAAAPVKPPKKKQ